jgi:alkanesulfonate monooxygenase SsuD/methylene tetrahydromethanopterin reductase-like flavin-dependent oxidoreductase (luciferase family)
LEAEHAAYGFDFPPTGVRMQMLAEQLELVLKEWDEGSFTLEGQHYSMQNLDALPKPITRPRLLLGGGGGRRSLALAARCADEYNVFHKSEEELRKIRSGLDDACESIGREPADLPLSLMDPVDKAPTEQMVERFRALESVGVTRVMLQHLQHEDLDTVEWIGRELAPALA